MNLRLAFAASLVISLSLASLASLVSVADARSAPRHEEDELLPEDTTPTSPPPSTDTEDDSALKKDAVELTLTRSSIPWTRRLEAGIGIRWGSFLINNIDAEGKVKQLHLDAGLRFYNHRVFVYGQYALQQMTIPIEEFAARDAGTPVAIGNGNGIMQRFATHGRYSFARAGEKDGGMDIYADVGFGVQHIRWDAGGAWTRPDIQISLGLSAFGVGDSQHGGLSAALVLTLAPRNDVEGAPPACGGPCDYPTPPTGTDRSLMFDITMMFGK